MATVFNFLRAARRNAEEHFVFPDPEHRVLASLNALRHALKNVEDMVRGSSDVDGTASDSEAEDPDTTKVNWQFNART
jgi:hypothetical protein